MSLSEHCGDVGASRSISGLAEPRVGLSEVRVFDGEGHLLRIIAPEALQARDLSHSIGEAPAVAPGSGTFYLPSAAKMQKAARALTARNKRRRKAAR